MEAVHLITEIGTHGSLAVSTLHSLKNDPGRYLFQAVHFHKRQTADHAPF